MKKFKLKKIVRQLHLILGLTSGLVVFIVGLAGATLAFEEEAREIFQHDFYHVKQVENQRLPFKQMQDTVKAHYPKAKITSIRFTETKDAAIIFYSKKDIAISINPYNARIIGVQDLETDFFTVILALHTHLLLGDFGAVIIKANVLIFFIMCVSGLILWWPKQARFFKQATTINLKTKNWKRLNWDLHSVLGFYALIILLLISLTGMFFVYDTVKNTVAFITGGKVAKEGKIKIEAQDQKHFNIDKAYQYMVLNYPGAQVTFITPAVTKTDAIRVQMRYPYTIVRHQNTVYFNPYNGKVLKTDLFKNYTGYDEIAASTYNLHTGRFKLIGIGSKIIYFFAGLIAAFLPVTGFMIWLGKRRKTKKQLKR